MRATKILKNVLALGIPTVLALSSLLAEELTVASPDGATQVSVQVREDLAIGATRHGKAVLLPSRISLELVSRPVLGEQPRIAKTDRRSVKQQVKPVVREKSATILEAYNELRVDFEGDYSLVIRAYDEGIAYRWETRLPGEITVKNEQVEFQFDPSASVYFQHENNFHSHNERPFELQPISAISSEKQGFLPVLVVLEGTKVLLTEADLLDYPGLWLRGNGNSTLTGVFPAYPLEVAMDLKWDARGRVTKRADFIAKTRGTRTFPWRVLAIADNDADLLTNQMVYLLGSPLRIEDPSWIKPGLAILDWWGRRSIFGVDFEAGVNTETYKHFIDFCADSGIDYYLLDMSWSSVDDLFDIAEGLDMNAVMAHAHKRGVGIFLWTTWHALDRQMTKALDQFSRWGVKGIKVDFMQRDDQWMVNFYERVAREAAKRKLMIDFHGSYKPTGLRRAYPNILTREGLIEFEFNGWSDLANPEHHTTLPFIRMVTGPMDYIPGTLNNAQKHEYAPIGDRPMGLGTRAHSIGLMVLFESPLQMIPDPPSDYYREPEITHYLAGIPVEWDETRVLHAKVGDYVAMARRNGENWYVGAITDWSARTLEIDFSFLDADRLYEAEIISDGPNSRIRAIDYKLSKAVQLRKGERHSINLAPGGGWVAKIRPTP
ncbi:MAG TPA: glycoside hydrolase family 97 protein [Acidobacteriota bacterium]|nr:glycoside hydrolase family 97 protein [Acidobacteriota bacterium]